MGDSDAPTASRGRRRLMRHAAAAGIALLLAACGGSSGDATSSTGGDNATAPDDRAESGSGSIDPCDLLTTAEIQAATGFPAGTGTVGGDDDEICTWVLETGDTGSGVSTVSVDLFDADLFATYTTGAEPVSGLGDAAAWRSVLWNVYVLQRDTGFSVQVVLLEVDQLPIATELATDVLARI